MLAPGLPPAPRSTLGPVQVQGPPHPQTALWGLCKCMHPPHPRTAPWGLCRWSYPYPTPGSTLGPVQVPPQPWAASWGLCRCRRPPQPGLHPGASPPPQAVSWGCAGAGTPSPLHTHAVVPPAAALHPALPGGPALCPPAAALHSALPGGPAAASDQLPGRSVAPGDAAPVKCHPGRRATFPRPWAWTVFKQAVAGSGEGTAACPRGSPTTQRAAQPMA